MTHPTDEALEAQADYCDRMSRVHHDSRFVKTAAMLRAVKGRVRVKPLLWEQARDGAGWHPQLTIAYCPIFKKRFYAEHPEKQAKIDAAREARILAALEPAPDYLAGWNDAREAVADVARKCVYHDAAGTGFEEEEFDAAIRALTPPERPKP